MLESRLIIESKSDHIGDSSLIGLSCESGDFSGCKLPESIETIPIGCEGVWIFSIDGNTCGSNCNSKRSKRSTTFGGWTPYYNNDDDPSGTGDHEHYFIGHKDWYYRNGNKKRFKAFGKDGTAYDKCQRTALLARQKNTHVKDFNEAKFNSKMKTSTCLSSFVS